MKKILISAMILCLLSFSVGASDDLATAGFWTQAGFSESANYTSNLITDFYSEGVTDNISLGSDFMPLVVDLDENGDNEFIISNGASVKIMDLDGAADITTEAEKALWGTQQGGMSVIDTDSGMRLLAVFGNNTNQTFYSLSYDGTTVSVEYSKNMQEFNSYTRIYTGIACTDSQALLVGGSKVCYFADGSSRVFEYFPENNSLHGYNVSKLRFKGVQPAISDFDNDGVKDVIFATDPNANDLQGYSIYDPESKTVILTGDDLTSRDPGQAFVTSVSFADLDGGNEEIIVATYTNVGTSNDQDTRIWVFDSTGAAYYGVGYFIVTSELGTTGYTGMTNVVIANVLKDGGTDNLEICAVGISEITTQTIRCFSTDNNSIAYEYTSTGVIFSDFEGITGADMNSDGYTDIITSTGVFFPQTGTQINFSGKEGGRIVAADVTDDGIPELISQSSGVSWSMILNPTPSISAAEESCTGPCIFYEPFNYTVSIKNNDWFVNPDDNTLTPTGLKLQLSSRTTALNHYYIDDLNPIISLRFNLTFVNISDFVSLSLRQADGLTEKGVISVLFQDGDIIAKGGVSGTNQDVTVCSSCYSNNENHLYELNIYLRNILEGSYDNVSDQWVSYEPNTFVLKQDGNKQGEGLPFLYNLSSVDAINTNMIHFYVSTVNTTTIDDIIIWKGTSANTNTDNTNSSLISPLDLENETVCTLGFCRPRNSMGTASFDCQANPQCCGVIGGEVKVKSQMCVLGVAFTGILDPIGAWILKNIFGFILIMGALIFLVPLVMYVNGRR